MNAPTSNDGKRAQARLAVIRENISTRLWSVNQGMSSPVFNALMDQMALLQLNCETATASEMRDLDRRLGQPDRRTSVAPVHPPRLSLAEEPVPDEEPH